MKWLPIQQLALKLEGERIWPRLEASGNRHRKGGVRILVMRRRELLGVALLAALAPVPERRAGASSFVVLITRGNPTASLSRSELRRLVTGGTKQWENGAVVQLGIIPADAGETQYLASLLDLTVRELLIGSRSRSSRASSDGRRSCARRASASRSFGASPGGLCIAADGEPLPPEVTVVPLR